MRGKGNWSTLDNPKVRKVARGVAYHFAQKNRGILDFEDLTQDALILCATHPSLIEVANEGEYALLEYRLKQKMFTKFIEPMLRSGEMYARKYKSVVPEDEDKHPTSHTEFDAGTGDYTDEMLRVLLPAVWDDSYFMGLPVPSTVPPSDMPKAATNKACANTHWALIIDTRRAWERAPLTRDERRSIFMVYGAEWTQEQAAAHDGVTHPAISQRITSGINKMVAFLNGAGLKEDTEFD